VRYWSKIVTFHTPLHSSPTLAESPFGVKKPEWCSYPKVKIVEDIFRSFDIIHTCDRQTNGQTDRHLVTV